MVTEIALVPALFSPEITASRRHVGAAAMTMVRCAIISGRVHRRRTATETTDVPTFPAHPHRNTRRSLLPLAGRPHPPTRRRQSVAGDCRLPGRCDHRLLRLAGSAPRACCAHLGADDSGSDGRIGGHRRGGAGAAASPGVVARGTGIFRGGGDGGGAAVRRDPAAAGTFRAGATQLRAGRLPPRGAGGIAKHRRALRLRTAACRRPRTGHAAAPGMERGASRSPAAGGLPGDGGGCRYARTHGVTRLARPERPPACGAARSSMAGRGHGGRAGRHGAPAANREPRFQRVAVGRSAGAHSVAVGHVGACPAHVAAARHGCAATQLPGRCRR